MKEDEKQPFKNRLNVSSYSISNSFDAKKHLKTDDVQQKYFLGIFFLIIKNHLLLQFVESSWLKKIVCSCVPKLFFLSKYKILMKYYLD